MNKVKFTLIVIMAVLLGMNSIRSDTGFVVSNIFTLDTRATTNAMWHWGWTAQQPENLKNDIKNIIAKCDSYNVKTIYLVCATLPNYKSFLNVQSNWDAYRTFIDTCTQHTIKVEALIGDKEGRLLGSEVNKNKVTNFIADIINYNKNANTPLASKFSAVHLHIEPQSTDQISKLVDVFTACRNKISTENVTDLKLNADLASWYGSDDQIKNAISKLDEFATMDYSTNSDTIQSNIKYKYNSWEKTKGFYVGLETNELLSKDVDKSFYSSVNREQKLRDILNSASLSGYSNFKGFAIHSYTFFNNTDDPLNNNDNPKGKEFIINVPDKNVLLPIVFGNMKVTLSFKTGDVSGKTVRIMSYDSTLPDSVNIKKKFSKALGYFKLLSENINSFSATLSFTYSNELLLKMGITEENLRITFWDSTKNIWKALKTDINTDRHAATSLEEVNHFSIWALTDKNDSLITEVTTEKSKSIPSNFNLEQNVPNPFNPTTTIKYQIPKTTQITLKIYNILGQEVKTLINKNMSPGNYEVQWDGTNNLGQKVSSGIYIYRMETNSEYVKTRKMLYLK